MMHLYVYITLSALFLGLTMGPFLRDPSGSRKRLDAWILLILATGLSPITLPNTMWRRLNSKLS
jgi:hypothetical protein